MKKLVTLFLLMIAVNANAQHLTFMGFPIDGTISDFQTKLATKGFVPNQNYNNTKAAVGGRLFEGVFCGYKARVFTYNNTKTKVVYRAKACINNTDIDYIKRIYNEIKDMLDEKYPNSCFIDGTQNGYDSYRLIIIPEEDDDCDNGYGTIELYITEFSDYYPTQYTLHIDYIDRINSVKNTSSNSDDL